MDNTKVLKNVSFQLCSVPDSEGLVLELSNAPDEPALLEVRVDADDVQWFRFFSSESHVAFTIDDIKKAVKIAEKEVVNTSNDFDSN